MAPAWPLWSAWRERFPLPDTPRGEAERPDPRFVHCGRTLSEGQAGRTGVRPARPVGGISVYVSMMVGVAASAVEFEVGRDGVEVPVVACCVGGRDAAMGRDAEREAKDT